MDVAVFGDHPGIVQLCKDIIATAQIEDAFKALGIEVDKKNITIPEDIKALGEYEGTVKIYKAVKAAVKFVVEAEA